MDAPSFVLSETFLNQRADVTSPRMRSRIDAALRTISLVPGVGSALVAPSIRARYGPDILKALAGPYLNIYMRTTAMLTSSPCSPFSRDD